MVPIKLNFGISDIFLSPRLALSGKKIWTLTIGNLIGYLSYVTFSFLSYEISYQDFSKSVTDLGLFPVLFGKDLSILSWFLYVTGIILWIVSYLFWSTILSKITLNQLKGNNSFPIINGIKFSLKNWKSIILSPLTILLLIILFFYHWNIFISFKNHTNFRSNFFLNINPYLFSWCLIYFIFPILFFEFYFIYTQYSFML